MSMSLMRHKIDAERDKMPKALDDDVEVAIVLSILVLQAMEFSVVLFLRHYY